METDWAERDRGKICGDRKAKKKSELPGGADAGKCCTES